jgi:hypothetical protein
MLNVFVRSISQVLTGAATAFRNFPAAILSALAFAVVTMVRIQLDWPQQEAYNFLLNCLHWSFALGALFGLAAITYAQSRINQARAFLAANLLSITVALVTFLILYFFSRTVPAGFGTDYATVSALAAVRVGTVMFISFLVFIYLAGFPKEQSDFARSFFMTHKAFFIALIYGAAITAGTTGVASAIQALLYEGMSEKVYMYIVTITGFLAFTIFVGYFPDFRKGKMDERREIAQNQPRFIEILLDYILVPIVLALTVVLLLWAGRTIFGGINVSFTQLASIASSYTIGGIWLYIIITHNTSSLAKVYRRFYPFAGLIILAFEAWALINQLNKSGLKLIEYNFTALWIIALVSALLLIFRKSKAYPGIVVLICTMAVIVVLPIVGYRDLPVTAQVNRLEKLLSSQGILQGDKLVPASTEPEQGVRESITDAVTYLASTQDAKLPAWFDKHLNDYAVFKSNLGFEPAYPKPDYVPNTGGYLGTSLMMPAESIDISDYRWVVVLGPDQEKGRSTATVRGEKGTYQINWNMQPGGGIPELKITLNDRVILQQDMKDYVKQITSTYPPSTEPTTRANARDMVLKLENPEIAVMLVFHDINVNVDVRRDTINYYMYLNALYLTEKP